MQRARRLLHFLLLLFVRPLHSVFIRLCVRVCVSVTCGYYANNLLCERNVNF